MFCPNCGTQLSDTATFCNNCGTKVAEDNTAQQVAPQAVQQAAPVPQSVSVSQAAPMQAAITKEKRRKKPLLIVLIILIVAAIAVGAVFIIPMLSGSGGVYSTHDELSYLGNNMGLYNGELIYGLGSYTSFGDLALSGNCYVTIDGKCITNGKIWNINNFLNERFCGYFAVAMSGSAVAYCTSDCGIELLDCETGEVTVIESSGDYHGVVISPDGKTVLYGDGHAKSSPNIYIYRNGTKTKLNISADVFYASVVAVDNTGRAYVRVFDSSHESVTAADLYCFDDKGNVTKIINNVATRFFANSDNTQIGFYTDRDGTESFSIYDSKTNEITKIDITGTSDYVGSMPMPLCDYSANLILFGDSLSTRLDMIPAVNYNTTDLLSCYYGASFKISSKGACEIKDGALVPITNSRLIKNLSDGSLVYCGVKIDGDEYGKLTRYINGSKEIIAQGVVAFGLSKDEKTIYYFTESEELWINKNGSNTKIADNVCIENYNDGFTRIGYETPCIVGNDIFIYRDNNGVCYIYNNGSVKTADNISSFLYQSLDIGYYGHLANRSVRNLSTSQNSMFFRTTNYLPFTDTDGNLRIMYADGSTKMAF